MKSEHMENHKALGDFDKSKPLGSKENPLKIHTICYYGVSSTFFQPVVAEALTNKRTRDRNLVVNLDGKEVYVRISPHGLLQSEIRDLRITAEDLRQRGSIVITPLNEEALKSTNFPEYSISAVKALLHRLKKRRVLLLSEPPLRTLYPYGEAIYRQLEAAPELDQKGRKVFNKFRNELLRRVRAELKHDEHIRFPKEYISPHMRVVETELPSHIETIPGAVSAVRHLEAREKRRTRGKANYKLR